MRREKKEKSTVVVASESVKVLTEKQCDPLDAVEVGSEWLAAQEERVARLQAEDFSARLTEKSWPFHGQECICLKCLTELLRSSFNMAQNVSSPSRGAWQAAKSRKLSAWGVGEATATHKAAVAYGMQPSELIGSVHALPKLGSKAAVWSELRQQFTCDRTTLRGRQVSVRTILFTTALKAWKRAGSSTEVLTMERLNAAFFMLLKGFVRGALAELATAQLLARLTAEGKLAGYSEWREGKPEEEGLDIDGWLKASGGEWLPVSIKSGKTMGLAGLNAYRLHWRRRHTVPQVYAGFEVYEEEQWVPENLELYTAAEVEALG